MDNFLLKENKDDDAVDVAIQAKSDVAQSTNSLKSISDGSSNAIITPKSAEVKVIATDLLSKTTLGTKSAVMATIKVELISSSVTSSDMIGVNSNESSASLNSNAAQSFAETTTKGAIGHTTVDADSSVILETAMPFSAQESLQSRSQTFISSTENPLTSFKQSTITAALPINVKDTENTFSADISLSMPSMATNIESLLALKDNTLSYLFASTVIPGKETSSLESKAISSISSNDLPAIQPTTSFLFTTAHTPTVTIPTQSFKTTSTTSTYAMNLHSSEANARTFTQALSSSHTEKLAVVESGTSKAVSAASQTANDHVSIESTGLVSSALVGTVNEKVSFAGILFESISVTTSAEATVATPEPLVRANTETTNDVITTSQLVNEVVTIESTAALSNTLIERSTEAPIVFSITSQKAKEVATPELTGTVSHALIGTTAEILSSINPSSPVLNEATTTEVMGRTSQASSVADDATSFETAVFTEEPTPTYSSFQTALAIVSTMHSYAFATISTIVVATGSITLETCAFNSTYSQPAPTSASVEGVLTSSLLATKASFDKVPTSSLAVSSASIEGTPINSLDAATVSFEEVLTSSLVATTASFEKVRTSSLATSSASIEGTPINSLDATTVSFEEVLTSSSNASSASFEVVLSSSLPVSSASIEGTPINSLDATTISFEEVLTSSLVATIASFEEVLSSSLVATTASFEGAPINSLVATTASFEGVLTSSLVATTASFEGVLTSSLVSTTASFEDVLTSSLVATSASFEEVFTTLSVARSASVAGGLTSSVAATENLADEATSLALVLTPGSSVYGSQSNTILDEETSSNIVPSTSLQSISASSIMPYRKIQF